MFCLFFLSLRTWLCLLPVGVQEVPLEILVHAGAVDGAAKQLEGGQGDPQPDENYGRQPKVNI